MKRNAIEPKLFDILKLQLKNHLHLPGNQRTIFSGKFGSGKTTFLEHFFKEEKDFLPITLYPVNYSIAANEDIFKYIKYDLFLELLPRLDLSKFETSELGIPETIFLYWKDKSPEIFENAISLMGSLGKGIHTSFEYIEKIATVAKKLRKEIKEYGEEISQKNDEYRAIYEFINGIKSNPSSLYEETILTKLLEKAIAQLKMDNKKVTVIIEDLDRIDPEHIFRILNVFSAHFDSKTSKGENSFGIDVLVVVCDEENVRNIFSNRYGSNVDYSGYIDKFYSLNVFHFNYTELAHDYIKNRVDKIQLDVGENKQPSDLLINVVLGDSFLKYLLTVLFDNKMINLRSINRVTDNPIRFSSVDLRFGGNVVSISHQLIIIEVLILVEIFGGISSTRKAIQHLANINENYPKRGKVIERLLAVLLANNGSKVTSKISIKLDEIGYTGTLTFDENEQNYVQDLVLSGDFGTIGIDAVRTKYLFTVLDHVLALLERNPRVRLHSYYVN